MTWLKPSIWFRRWFYEYLWEKKHASIDELLGLIYTNLVNAHRPHIDTIEQVLAKYCQKVKIKGQKREHYRWKQGLRSPLEVQREKEKQTELITDHVISESHNGIILRIAQQAKERGLNTHVGSTEQKRNGSLRDVSLELSHFSLGIPKRAFDIIRQIDLLIMQDFAVLAAVEVVTSLGTLSKAVNDRFRNLLHAIPNLTFRLFVVVNDDDFEAAYREIHSPANIKEGLAGLIRVIKTSTVISPSAAADWPFHK